MAEQQVSFLAGQAGNLVKAHGQFKDAPVEYGNMKLPPGINDGVAQLDEMKFGVYKEGENKGKTFFMATGIVQSPEDHNGVSIKGLRTQGNTPIPLCDTPKAQGKKRTFADHYYDFQNTLKQFGVEMPPERLQGENDIKAANRIEEYFKAAMKTLNISKPYFRFNTWAGKPSVAFPQPRTNEVWGGVCEYNPSANGTVGGMQDNTQAPSGPPTDSVPSNQTLNPPPGADAIDAEAPLDIEALVATAEADATGDTDEGKAAIQKLTELAQANGWDETTITEAANWTAVGEMAVKGPDATLEPEPEPTDFVPEPSETIPVKSSIIKYAPRDAKGNVKLGKDKKPMASAEYEILTVDTAGKVVTLKNVKTKNILLGTDKKPFPVLFDHIEN